ncbi:MAG: hypothetical protein KA371_09620 [Acidobacteria bacterium]|nr:hypothetical protein [Acidobacteriota bacterium]
MRRLVALAAVCAASLTVAPALSGQSRGAKAPVVTGGNGTLYIGTYKAEVEIYDEATEKLTGTIKLKSGIPRSITFSPDRTRFYALDSRLEQIEVVDVATRQTIDSFKLTAGNKLIRVSNLQPDPANKYLILMYRAATKLIDRWEIGPPTLQMYDLTTHQFTRVVPWPRGDERETVNMRIGPDGKHLFIFGEEVTVLETEKFTEVESWPFARPTETGLGRINLGPVHDFNDPPGMFTGLFTMADPERARRTMGIGRVDLKARTLDFQPIGPASNVSPFAQSPDRKRAYGITQEIGNYEFWTFDLEKNSVLMRTKFEGRPRMGIRVSSNGKLFYVHVAGATLDVYEAATHKYLRTIHLGADQTTDLIVMPSTTPATTAAR